MTTHTIRPVLPRDLAPILHLTQIIPEAPTWGVEDFRKLAAAPDPFAPDSALTRQAWVADANSRLLGLVVVQCLRIPSEPDQPTECELESILVHPEARRLGLGRQLLSTALDWCAHQNATVLHLEVRASNMVAIRLYEAAGFTRTGNRPRYYSVPKEDALLMQYSFTNFRNWVYDRPVL